MLEQFYSYQILSYIGNEINTKHVTTLMSDGNSQHLSIY